MLNLIVEMAVIEKTNIHLIMKSIYKNKIE
jgi:hypothetical protein